MPPMPPEVAVSDTGLIALELGPPDAPVPELPPVATGPPETTATDSPPIPPVEAITVLKTTLAAVLDGPPEIT